MGTEKKWTRNQKLLFGTLIIGAIGLCVHFLEKKAVKVDGDVGAIGDNANVTIDKRTGVDANLYGAEREKRVIAEIQVERYKAEMNEIEATKHDELIKRYAFGYILFYIDHINTVIPYESRLKAECSLDLTEAKVKYVDDKGIDIELPNIECKNGPRIIRSSYGISREVGKQTKVFGRFLGIQMYLELLVDHGDSFVCVLGFADVSVRK
jgi:hypothetical protein